jgi:hypothetical protein
VVVQLGGVEIEESESLPTYPPLIAAVIEGIEEPYVTDGLLAVTVKSFLAIVMSCVTWIAAPLVALPA